MFLDYGRMQENAQAESANSKDLKLEFKPRTFLLQGSSAPASVTMQLIIVFINDEKKKKADLEYEIRKTNFLGKSSELVVDLCTSSFLVECDQRWSISSDYTVNVWETWIMVLNRGKLKKHLERVDFQQILSKSSYKGKCWYHLVGVKILFLLS